MILTFTDNGIFFALKAAIVKPAKTFLDAMDIMKLSGGIYGGMLMKDYAAYKKWITEWYEKSLWSLIAIKLPFNG